MRQFVVAALLAAGIWVPNAVTPPVAQAAVCTGWSSTTTPPTSIRVLRTATGVVQPVDFETYVKAVMPAEWPSVWPMEVLRAGAVAIKQYAWYYAIHYRGGTGTGGCYDVKDNTIDQIYSPETRAPAASHILAVEDTWPESVLKNGSFILTGYRSGGDVACGSDADGYHLWQYSAHYCALAGQTGEQILQQYFNPGVTIQGLSTAPPPSPTTYVPLAPARILDTRDGTGGLTGPFTSRVARTFQVTGCGGVPAGATAVTGNLTVTQQGSLGYLFIGPVANNYPTSSTLNFPTDDDRANSVTVALGSGGSLSVTYAAPTLGPTAHVIFDVTGYFIPDTTGATYHAIAPSRILDTRTGTGGLAGPFVSHVARTFQVTGNGGVPAGATAVTGNLTVTGQSYLGFLYVGPAAMNDPTSSTLNFPKYDDRANAVTVTLGAGGTLSVTYAAPVAAVGATANAIFDVTGYFTPDGTGASYFPISPTRLLDTRDGTGGLFGPSRSHVARSFQVSGNSWVPATATAVTGNLTVTGQTSIGFLFIGPSAVNDPPTSTLNFPKNDDRANSVAVALGAGGKLSITYAAPSFSSTAHVIFDATGYFVPASSDPAPPSSPAPNGR
jgi:hypothetical protein